MGINTNSAAPRALGHRPPGGRRSAAALGAIWLAWAGLILASGCGPSQSQSAPRESSNLKPLALLYGRYLGAHQGNPPPNEAALKSFIQSLPPEQLSSMRATDVDKLFVSSRDGQPYVVVYGKTTGPPGTGGAPIIAYEQTGVDGKRFVASSLGAVDEVDETRFRQLVPSAP